MKEDTVIRRNLPLFLVIAAIAASWIGNGIHYNREQLDKPVFFQHFIELGDYPEQQVELNLLENINGGKRVTSLEFPGFELYRVNRSPNEQQYRYQMNNKFLLTIEKPTLDILRQPDQAIKQAKVYYSDGTGGEGADIGEIRFSGTTYTLNSPVEHSSSMGSSDNLGYSVLRVTEPVTLTSIGSELAESISDWLKIDVDITMPADPRIPQTNPAANSNDDKGIPWKELQLPVELPKGSTIKISYQFQFNKGDLRAEQALNYYRILLWVEGVEKTGRPFNAAVHIQYDPYPSERDVSALTQRARGLER
ncbi:hypothetical protein [Paenibacillus mendelii]|uniref:DUF5643 domain-containing protein n=1 Tax=Paenibacillus mendelii TaxID=206163 RepID=A0ABV6JIW2_9BACL|nr:hypothetical protein [Paenibacillus mendelii]MCQ6558784.1 hypothetical protein [Paenibacillus mendelii]